MKLQGMIFDLDGTLGDTLPVCFAAYRRTFEVFLGKTFTDSEIEAMFGPNEEGIVQRLVPKPVDEFMPTYLEAYEQAHDHCEKPFPGIIPALDLLKENGVRMGIVTGKGAGSLEISLRRLRIAGYFDAVETGSMQGVIKPVSIRKILETWNISPTSVGYLGDALADMRSAHEAGVIPLAAAWADTADYDALLDTKPHAIFRTPDEFHQWVKTVLNQKH